MIISNVLTIKKKKKEYKTLGSNGYTYYPDYGDDIIFMNSNSSNYVQFFVYHTSIKL